MYDISEHERFAEEVKKLDRLNVIGEMAAGVAHEIRNPMTVMKGYLQRLQMKCHDDCAMKDKIPIVLEELARVETIVSDFLSLANNKTTTMACCDLNKIVNTIEPLIASHAIEHGIEMKMDLANNLPVLKLDEKEIRQLVINLSRNAVEAMTKHGLLTIKTEVRDGQVLLQVQDTGSGIPPENLHKIFNPFYTSKETGTGLGLSICASIVERHGGRISVQSELGLGTCFTVSFPCCC